MKRSASTKSVDASKWFDDSMQVAWQRRQGTGGEWSGDARQSCVHLPGMRACIQRVSQASVTVEERVVGRIERGLVVLLGVGHNDAPEDARRLAEKIVGLRIFDEVTDTIETANFLGQPGKDP